MQCFLESSVGNLEHSLISLKQETLTVTFIIVVAGKPVDPSFPLVHSVSNVICAVVFGHRFSREDETFHELIKATEYLFKFGGSFIYHVSEWSVVFFWIRQRVRNADSRAVCQARVSEWVSDAPHSFTGQCTLSKSEVKLHMPASGICVHCPVFGCCDSLPLNLCNKAQVHGLLLGHVCYLVSQLICTTGSCTGHHDS